MRLIGVKPRCPLCKQIKKDFMSINSKLPINKRFKIMYYPFIDPQSICAIDYKLDKFAVPFILIDDILITGYRRDLTYITLKVLELNGDLIDYAKINYRG
jgi:hypothetical protein